MIASTTPLDDLRSSLRAAPRSPAQVAAEVVARANANASRNTYLRFDSADVHAQAAALAQQQIEEQQARQQLALFGVPTSLKDCFDLAGTVTTVGTHFYAQHNAPAPEDSAVAQRLRSLGCLITGKTHLHPLAYGITGENPDYGACVQPRDAGLLTGGSSSGAAASVQEGSAMFAIGTDTGGSIRVPAALCGLSGFRASHSMPLHWPGMWRGGVHLAPSFDTLGFLTRDPRDLEPIALALFGLQPAGDLQGAAAPDQPRIGVIAESFLHDSNAAVLASFVAWQNALRAAGCALGSFDAKPFGSPLEIFAPIQASEAAAIHRGNFDAFDPTIAERLRWGASLSAGDIAALRHSHELFRAQLNELFQRFDFLILPAAPIDELRTGADHSAARATILRYTTPFSLGGNPVVSLPGEFLSAPRGTGVQVAAAPGRDAPLLAFVRSITQRIADSQRDVQYELQSH